MAFNEYLFFGAHPCSLHTKVFLLGIQAAEVIPKPALVPQNENNELCLLAAALSLSLVYSIIALDAHSTLLLFFLLILKYSNQPS